MRGLFGCSFPILHTLKYSCVESRLNVYPSRRRWANEDGRYVTWQGCYRCTLYTGNMLSLRMLWCDQYSLGSREKESRLVGRHGLRCILCGRGKRGLVKSAYVTSQGPDQAHTRRGSKGIVRATKGPGCSTPVRTGLGAIAV
ncbi:hypothetical protein F4803DRAFT_413662 [Xylaria telfairii]|nr:hypothetical protein F4803DRAFT_413662 [Xylaria telfairii]